MIFVFHGGDTYRSRKKLAELVENFREKAKTGLNIHRFDAEEDETRELESFLAGSSLFSVKKLVIARNVFAAQAAYELLKKYAPLLSRAKDTIVFLWEQELSNDAKKRVKELSPFLAKSEEFKPLTTQEAARFIRREAQQKGISLDPAQESYLASLGSDLWAVSNELEKIALYSVAGRGHAAPRRSVRTTVFDVGDSFFSSSSAAIGRLLEFLSAGNDEFNLFSYLAGQSRTLLTVKYDLEKSGAVSSKHGIHPFVVKKATAMARTLPLGVLQETLFSFFEEDRKIKTGESTPRESLTRMLIEKKN